MRKKYVIIVVSLIIIVSIVSGIIIFKNNLVNILIKYQDSAYRNFLEILYFLTTPLLFIVATIGLKELSISKENAKLQAKREAYKISAEQCNYYFAHIIPEINALDELIIENDIDWFKKCEIEIKSEKISVNNCQGSLEIFNKVGEEVLDVLNHIESFAVFFVSGVADEKVAYSSVGSTFCFSVKKLLPLFIAPDEQKHFINTIKLLVVWNTRLEEEALYKKAKAEEVINQDQSINLKTLGT